MAVSISRTADPAGVSASSNVVTYSTQSIGTAAEDRVIFLLVGSELASASPNSATIDYGTGAVAMSAGTQGNFGAVYSRIFYAKAPTGTTADFAVTFGANPSNTQNHVSVYRVVGARFSLTSGGNGSTDMDATAPLTTGSITIPSNGGFIATAAGANNNSTKTWANATEDLDADVTGFRHTTATRTTSGTVTVTCTGTVNAEDGAMSWVILTPGTFVNPNAGSYSLTGTDATPKLGKVITAEAGSYTLTGTAATQKKGQVIAAGAGSYFLAGTDATPKQARVVTASGGSYALTGTDASPKRGFVVAAGAGSYVLTGTDADLIYTSAGGYTIVAGGGVYTLSGTNAGIVHGWRVAGSSGSYLLTGTDAALTAATVTAQTQTAGGGWEWLNNLNPPIRRPSDEADETEQPRRKRKRKSRKQKPAAQIILETDAGDVETGIVPIRPANDVLARLGRQMKFAEAARAERFRRMAIADDEWMMTA